jgi:uncharacterized protein
VSSTVHDSLIVFTRLPQAGKAKTRLIPALGAEGAAALQRRMTQHTVGRAWACAAVDKSLRLRIAYDGGSEAEMRTWLGPLDFVPQGEGDLGQRISRCIQREFDAGARYVIVIGTDCPRLDEALINETRRDLQHTPLVFGPAQDGGYYLVGLARPMPCLFEAMTWSTDQVLAESLNRARQWQVEPALLAPLPDVDLPTDLADAEAALAQGRSISVIIPTLNESENLARLLPRLNASSPLEILVADGGSTDHTALVAVSHGAHFLSSERGRARQMNTAAAQARGEHLLFLHADTDPPQDFGALIAQQLDEAGVAAGAFRLALREEVIGKAIIEKLVAWRCAKRQLPYGDQGLFLRRSIFQGQNGFPDWPILEDVQLVRQLRQVGRIVITDAPALTSARRWQRGGVLRTFLRHQLILLGHFCGVSPERLAGWRT